MWRCWRGCWWWLTGSQVTCGHFACAHSRQVVNMATVSQSGTVSSVAADASALLLTIKWANPSPPPPELSKTVEVPSGPMQVLAAGLKVGEMVTVETDSAAPTVATKVKKP